MFSKFHFNYSQKNIPVPNRDSYIKLLIAKTGDFIERLRWKAFFFLNPEASKADIPNTFGFNTSRNAPLCKDISAFENALFDLVTNVKFRNKPKDDFQKDLQKKVSDIKKSDKVFVLADKTTNIYKVEPDSYNRLLSNNITKDYKKSSRDDVDDVNKEAKVITEKLKIDDRVDMHSENPAYITLKDHKGNFTDNPKCRLINPAKSQIGKISKQLLENINTEIRVTTKLKQWRSTEEALNWFKQIDKSTGSKFLQLDIVEFYPSIKSELLDKAFDFAESVLKKPIGKDTKNIVKNSRKAFLFTQENETPWVKQTETNFDVTMGAPDGAELCEFVGLYLLHQIKEQCPELDFGLYRDDGLAAHRRIPGRSLEKLRQKLHQIFKDQGLRITIDTNLTITNFLDVTLNITDGSYSPYRKPNSLPLYVHSKSNHPPNIIRELPKAINRRLKKISSSKEIFEGTKQEYQNALTNSGYEYDLLYDFEKSSSGNEHNIDSDETNLKQPSSSSENCNAEQTNKKRKRDILWFNPPFNSEVSTNIGKRFLELIDRHFPKGSKLSKCFNRNCVKISYSCMPNVKNIIKSHNKKVNGQYIEKQQTKVKQVESTECNCRNKAKCPLNNKCCVNKGPVVYKAAVKDNQGVEHTYIGSSVNFKDRYRNHTKSFRDPTYKTETTLSNFIWSENLGSEPSITWSIVAQTKVYQKGARYCDLCLTEKLKIAKELRSKPFTCLNKRSDLTNKCVHRSLCKLARIKL